MKKKKKHTVSLNMLKCHGLYICIHVESKKVHTSNPMCSYKSHYQITQEMKTCENHFLFSIFFIEKVSFKHGNDVCTPLMSHSAD